MADHRSDIYRDPTTDKLIFRASSINRCDLSLIYAALEYPEEQAPDKVQRGYDEGSAAEDQILARFCEGEFHGTKWKLLDPADLKSYHDGNGAGFPYSSHEIMDDGQFTIEIPVGLNWVVRGHGDGVAQCFEQTSTGIEPPRWIGKRVVVEAKFLGPDYFRKFLKHGISAFPYYEWQVSTYGMSTGLDVMFIVGEKLRRDDGQAPDVGRVKVVHIRNSDLPVKLAQLKMRVMKIGKMVEVARRDGIDALGLGECDGKAQYPCAFYPFHAEKVDAFAPEAKVEVKQGSGAAIKVDKEKPEAITITDAKDLWVLRKSAQDYESALKTEKGVKAMKAKAKADVDALLEKYRVKGVMIDGKDGEVEYRGGTYTGIVDGVTVTVEWTHSYSPGGEPTVTSSRTTDSPKFTLKKVDDK